MINIPISCAIVKNKNNFLILKRSKKSRMPDLWEFPAGKVEVNEKIIDALKRELKEETALEANAISFLGFHERYDEKTNKIIFGYLIDSYSGRLEISEEHSDYKWIHINDILKENIGLDTKYFVEKFLLNRTVENKDFDIFLSRFVSECKDKLSDQIENISLVGSHSRNESTYPWSDIDIFILVKSGEDGKLSKQILDTFNRILSEANPKGIKVWLKIKTKDEFPHSFSTDFVFNFSKDAKTLYGRDVKKDFLDEMKRRGENSLKTLIKKDAYEKRFWTRYYYTGITDKNVELRNTHYERHMPNFDKYLLLGQLVDNIIEICQSILFKEGIQPTDKKTITEKFSETFSKYKYSDVPKKMALARYKWGELSEVEMEELKKEAIEFLEDVCSRIIHEKPLE